ncbi:thiazolylpeptide-type bacteriocin [Dellaglioa sp. L3N]
MYRNREEEKKLIEKEFYLEVEMLDLDEVSVISEITASSGSTSCSASSTFGSC